MNRSIVATALVAAAALTACSSEIPTTPSAQRSLTTLPSAAASVNEGSLTNEHVFVMSAAIPSDFNDAVAQAGGSVVYSIGSIGVVVTTGLTDEAAESLASGNGKVERDVNLQWVPTPADVAATTMEYDGVVAESRNPATAAFFACCQWNMRQIEAHKAWAVGAQAPGVRVAILDTGLDDRHIDQAGLIDMVASKAFVRSVSIVPGPDWRDDNFHGTHVGGIVVANGIGVAGVAPNATLIAVKVLDVTGRGTVGNLIAGIVYATDVGADVINLSLAATFPKNATGGGRLVAAMNRALNYAHQHDVVTVSAAGNSNADLQHNGNQIVIPCESGVGICVSATGPSQAKASYSDYGSSAIAVASPGGEIGPPTTSFIISPCSSYSMVIASCRGSTVHYVFLIGTSQAAPHVSGLAALLRAQGHRGASQIITTIENTADDLGKPGTDQIYGRGRINAFRAWTNN